MRSSSVSISSTRTDAALTVLRVAIGAIFAAHGAQKVFVYGFAGVSGAFGQMGVPMAGIVGPAVALLEFFGGLALVIGLFTRLTSIGLASTMLGAITLVHFAAGFFAPKGIEFPLSLLAATIALTITGAGRYSVDALVAKTRAAAPVTTTPGRTIARAA